MSENHVDSLVTKYQARGVVIDTNLLLVYLMGKYSVDRLSRFKRTASYSEEDYELLVDIISKFSRVITTPHVLTEVSNLTGQLSGELRREFFQHFGEELKFLDEEFNPAFEVCRNHQFTYLGLTDSAIIRCSKSRYLVLTDDAGLFYALSDEGSM
jgi:hypothetical protein